MTCDRRRQAEDDARAAARLGAARLARAEADQGQRKRQHNYADRESADWRRTVISQLEGALHTLHAVLITLRRVR